ncbi:hypothetical protein THAOC_12853, partial [Thalassiosira oceanica]
EVYGPIPPRIPEVGADHLHGVASERSSPSHKSVPSRKSVPVWTQRYWLELPDKGSPNHLSDVENMRSISIAQRSQKLWTEEHGVSGDYGHLAVIRHLSGTLLGHGNTIIPKHGRRVHDDHAIGSPSSSRT